MSKRRVFTEEEQCVVRDAYLRGVLVREIGSLVGCTPEVVSRYLRENGFDVKKGRYERVSRSVQGTLRARYEGLRARGVFSPKKRVFSEEEARRVVEAFSEEKKSVGSIGAEFGCSGKVVTRLLRELGVDTRQDQGERIRRAVLEGYRRGRSVPASVGRGRKVVIQTPFQGAVTVRSQLEASRAAYLTDQGVPWFYEVERFRLVDGRTYLPDFWVAERPLGEVRGALGEFPEPAEVLRYLARVPFRVEEVKGWWRPDTPSYEKVSTFRGQYEGAFNVVVKTKGGWSCL